MSDFDKNTNFSMRKQILEASGEAVIKATHRKIRIVDIILRENGLPSIFVTKYEDSRGELDQYLFYREELTFPSVNAQSFVLRSKLR